MLYFQLLLYDEAFGVCFVHKQLGSDHFKLRSDIQRVYINSAELRFDRICSRLVALRRT